MGPIEQRKLRVVASGKNDAAKRAKKEWRRQFGSPKVLSVELDKAA